MSRPILVKSRYAENFVCAARQYGIPVDRILARNALHIGVLEDGNGEIAVQQLEGLVSDLVLKSGKLDLGLDAAKSAALEDHGDMSNLFTNLSLFERLNAFCDVAEVEYSQRVFGVRSLPNGVSLFRTKISGAEVLVRQLELYVLVMMVEAIRIDLGSDWTPQAIVMQSHCSEEIETLFGSARIQALFGRDETEIFISNAELGASLSTQPSTYPNRLFGENTVTCSHFVSTLVSNHLNDTRLSLQFISRLAGIHERQLQRHLKSEGARFSAIVVHRRLQLAVKELAATDLSMLEISKKIGYSNQSHFTRAFKCHFGITPLAYRHTLSS